MTSTIPEWVAAQGNWNAYVLPAAANLAEITVAEFGAGVDITCFMPDPNWDGIGGEQSKGEQTRACMRESFEVLGRIKRSIADVTYTVLAQAASNDPANKVATLLSEGADVVVVVRRGLPSETAIAANQKYSAISATVGMAKENVGGSDDSAPTTNTSSFSAQGGVVKGTVHA